MIFSCDLQRYLFSFSVCRFVGKDLPLMWITVGDEKGRIELNPTPLFTLDAVEDMTGMVMSPRNTLYIGDAKSGTGSGIVYEYDLYGRILNTYTVGGTPGALFADR